MNRKRNRSLRVLIVTLAIVTVLGVLSQSENSLLSAGINAVSAWMFRLTASATSSVDSASKEELQAEVEVLRRENATLREQLADYLDVKSENEKLWK